MQRSIQSKSVFGKEKGSSRPHTFKQDGAPIINRQNVILRSLHLKQELNHPQSKDKQQIHLELMQTKNLYNKAVEENMRLKTRIVNLTKEVGELREVALEVSMRVGDRKEIGSDGQVSLNRGMVKMKQAIKQQKEKNRIISEELQTLKKSLKVVRVNELQSELKRYAEEASRLKSIICMEKEQNKEESQGKTESLKKLIREVERQNKQLVRDNEDYKYRIKCSLSMIEKVMSEPKKELKIQHLKRVKVVLDANVEKNKENEIRRLKRIAENNPLYHSQKGEGLFRANYKPVERIQFTQTRVGSPILIQTHQFQPNSKLLIPQIATKKSLQIIEQKAVQTLAGITITFHQNPSESQPSSGYNQDEFCQSESAGDGSSRDKSLGESEIDREELDRTEVSIVQNGGSLSVML